MKDLSTKELVGWAIDTRLTASLAIAALDMATKRKQPDGGLIHHFDRGVQYASGDYQQRLRFHEVQPSMSRKGNCRDNAPMESSFATFKTELIYRQQFAARDDSRAAIFKNIEVFRNCQRRHASIGNISPAEFERLHHAAQMVT